MARLEATVAAFARAEWRRLARKVVHRMQRIPAAGLFDDYLYRTLWDEYCHDVQTGPYGPLQEAWETTIDGLCAEVVGKLDPPLALLLSLDAVTSLDESMIGIAPGDIWSEGLTRCLDRALSEIAADRSMDRFETGEW